MKTRIEEFVRSKDFLVCVDSDGCAMDTMEVKHKECFGPEAVKQWELQEVETEFLKVWNRINLYSRTRGINRFKGLAKTFEEMNSRGYDVPLLLELEEWIRSTKELSNPSLEAAYSQTGSQQLGKALEWSRAVNKGIEGLPMEPQPFSNVKEALNKISTYADVAIVSSANGAAVVSEWTQHGLAPMVEILLGQESGTKAACIEALMKRGYSKEKVLMVGDALGDLEAASSNGVLYYPILAGKEAGSWQRLMEEAFDRLLEGTYSGEYQHKLTEEFNSSLE